MCDQERVESERGGECPARTRIAVAQLTAAVNPKAVEAPLPFIKEHFAGIQAKGNGWLLEKGPRLAEHFEAWKDAGVYPDKVYDI